MNWEAKATNTSSEDEAAALKRRFPLPEPDTQIWYYIQQQILKLGKRLQIRQIALATAQVYVLRFYASVDIRKTNPYLILTTAFYLACKTEECPQHIRMVAQEARNFWPDHMQGTDTAVLGECEFSLIQALNAQLVVHHPYADLLAVKDSLGLSADETQLAWHAINDFHASTVVLTHSPRTIAAAAISVVLTVRPSSSDGTFAGSSGGVNSDVVGENGKGEHEEPSKQQKLVNWLSRGGFNIEEVVECTQALISLYASLETYSESTAKQQFGSLARARGIVGV